VARARSDSWTAAYSAFRMPWFRPLFRRRGGRARQVPLLCTPSNVCRPREAIRANSFAHARLFTPEAAGCDRQIELNRSSPPLTLHAR